MKSVSIFLSFMVSFSVSAQSLQQDIDSLVEKTFPQATIGIMVTDPESGQTLYERNANKFLSPASNIKLLTAAAALHHFGPDARYITTLSAANQNFYITFSGSPSFTTTDLKELISSLKDTSIKTITGNIVLDTSQFLPPYHPAGASYDDLGWYYNAPSTAIILNGNELTYDFISAKELGRPITIKTENTDAVLTLINDVQTVSKDDAKLHCNLNVETKEGNTVHLYGCLSQTEHPRKMHLAIPQPTLYAKQMIKKALKENNIVFKGNVIEGKTPAQTKFIAARQSDGLSKLVKHMLEESDNLYADSLTKHLAYSLTGQGTYKQGAFAIKKMLTEYSNMDMHQLELADGAGTRYNLVTAQQLTIFLTDVYQDKKMKQLFFSALPRMGVSGTLKDRMKETNLQNQVLDKTGSMHDISALSGYLITPTGKTLIFSMISNGIHGHLAKAKGLEEKILLAVSASLQDKSMTTDSPS